MLVDFDVSFGRYIRRYGNGCKECRRLCSMITKIFDSCFARNAGVDINYLILKNNKFQVCLRRTTNSRRLTISEEERKGDP